MPALRKLRIGALNDLADQLRFAPAETLRRQLERAEELAGEIDPTVNYPEDWVIFRVTGYRPQLDAPAIVVGEALLGDMSALVERLSASARLREDELERGRYLSESELESRWKVSRKTLDRYRLRGLIARRVLVPERGGAVSRLAFLVDSIERFERLHSTRLSGAAGFSRIDDTLERTILVRAERYRRLGCTLNQAAERLAQRHGRAVETVRQLLRRNGEFTQQGPPTKRERGLIERAWFRGIETGAIARRLERPSASVQRIVIDARASRLRSLRLERRGLPRAAEAALASEYCSRGLGGPGAPGLSEFLAAGRAAQPPAAPVERTRITGYHALMARAALGTEKLSRHGNSATLVDEVETLLRWAARVKAELVRSEIALVIRTLEAAIERPLEDNRPAMVVPLIMESLLAVSGVIDGFEPVKGGRLAAPVGMAITRIAVRVARDARGPDRTRAAARATGTTQLPDWTRMIAPWQAFRGGLWLEPDPRVRAGLFVLDDRERRLLTLRMGWGGPPRTLVAAASEVDLPPVRAAALERRAMNKAVAAARLGAGT